MASTSGSPHAFWTQQAEIDVLHATWQQSLPLATQSASVIGDDGGLRRVAARIAVDALLMGAAVSESTPEEITAVMTTGLGALVDSPAGDGR